MTPECVVRSLKSIYMEVKKDKAENDWECVAPWLVPNTPVVSRPFGITYVASDPQFAMSSCATLSSDTSVDAECDAKEQQSFTCNEIPVSFELNNNCEPLTVVKDMEQPKSARPTLGKTYVVKDPKYVTSGTPLENCYDFPPPLLIPDDVILEDVEPQNGSEPHQFVAEDINTTVLHSS
ncbi:hypothetical protein ONE63_000032 [Megalurothrips usitatus]|uniref:Uncharacterized protein n=1 Tax=Megalurothrips usitatus TaxID=439358 RepID=A0AAV7Y0A4_9NEOP|nr:hypothetical protein ONE63_000032 [Megalurothrips usitatus]